MTNATVIEAHGGEFAFAEEEFGVDDSPGSVTATPVFIFAVTGVVLALAAVSLAASASTGASVWLCCTPRAARYGYFHLAALFCVVDAAYFAGKAALWAANSAALLDLVDLDGSEFASARFRSLSGDVLTCLFGTGLLLVSSLTVDCLAWTCVRSKGCQKCLRTAMGVSSLLLGAAALFAATLIREDGRSEDRAYLGPHLPLGLNLDERERIIVVSCLFLGLFAVAPLLVVATVGACNWVSDGGSTRRVGDARRATRALDRRVCLLSTLLLLLFLVGEILRLALHLGKLASASVDEGAEVASAVAGMAADAAFAVLPALFACALGSFCCCCYNGY